jgi:hypothetical protein
VRDIFEFVALEVENWFEFLQLGEAGGNGFELVVVEREGLEECAGGD